MKLVLILLTVLVASHPMPGYAVNCSVAATPVSFLNYDVFSTIPTYSAGTVTVSCNNPNNRPMPVTVAISTGNSGTFNPRQLTEATGNDRLDYYLFTDAARTVIWGDGTGGTATVSNAVSKSAPWNATVYGSLPQRQNVRGGSYNDTVLVTVTW